MACQAMQATWMTWKWLRIKVGATPATSMCYVRCSMKYGPWAWTAATDSAYNGGMHCQNFALSCHQHKRAIMRRMPHNQLHMPSFATRVLAHVLVCLLTNSRYVHILQLRAMLHSSQMMTIFPLYTPVTCPAVRAVVTLTVAKSVSASAASPRRAKRTKRSAVIRTRARIGEHSGGCQHALYYMMVQANLQMTHGLVRSER